MAQIQEHLLAVYDKIFLDEDRKDVTFELADGQERAHRLVLEAASDVFASMFKQDMKEKGEGVVKMPDTTRAAMRVFLRLLYTGNVDPSDWNESEENNQSKTACVVDVLRHANMNVQGKTLTSTAANWRSNAFLDCGGATDFEFTVRRSSWEDYVFLGVAPSGTNVETDRLYKHAGFHCYFHNHKVGHLYSQGETEVLFAATDSPLPPNASVTVKFHEGSLMFSVNGGDFAKASFNSGIPSSVSYVPVIAINRQDRSVEIVDDESLQSSSCQCPLGVLLSVAKLAKKYMVSFVQSVVTQVLKQRLRSAKELPCTRTFEQIFSTAIAEDLGAVRMAAVDLSKEFIELRRCYDTGTLRPEVAYELEAIWPGPSAPPGFKRRRLA